LGTRTKLNDKDFGCYGINMSGQSKFLQSDLRTNDIASETTLKNISQQLEDEITVNVNGPVPVSISSLTITDVDTVMSGQTSQLECVLPSEYKEDDAIGASSKGILLGGKKADNTFEPATTTNAGYLNVDMPDGVKNIQNGFADSNNSSTTPLASLGVYEGTYRACVEYSMFSCMVTSSHEGTLEFIFSSDETNIDRAKTVQITSNGGVFTLAIISKYMKVKFTNTSLSTQTTFRLQTIFHKYKSKNLTATTSQRISDQNDVELIRVVNDPILDLARSVYTDKYTVHKFGRNPSVANSTWEDL